jgi:transposase-like protein
MARKRPSERPELRRSPVVEELPIACSNEQAAVEFLERKRWGDCPCCPECGSVAVYRMKSRDGARNARFMWRCKDCSKQYTVRTGTVLAESLVPLHKWCRAMWMTASGKNGVSALELSRAIQVNYRTALFMLHRLRHAMTDNDPNPPKLDGIVECDETYVGARKPRYTGQNKRGRGTSKQPVAAVLQRGGTVRTRVIPRVNGHNLRAMLMDNVATTARVMTDGEQGYRGADAVFASHEVVDHGRREYVRGDITTNGVEGFFARVKRGINGVYHNVSREHLHRYMDHFAFMHNTRFMTDGERTLDLLRRTQGKRLLYRDPVTKRDSA